MQLVGTWVGCMLLLLVERLKLAVPFFHAGSLTANHPSNHPP